MKSFAIHQTHLCIWRRHSLWSIVASSAGVEMNLIVGWWPCLFEQIENEPPSKADKGKTMTRWVKPCGDFHPLSPGCPFSSFDSSQGSSVHFGVLGGTPLKLAKGDPSHHCIDIDCKCEPFPHLLEANGRVMGEPSQRLIETNGAP
jgi:hypothetical protein